MFPRSWQSQEVPLGSKLANLVVPVSKKSKKEDPGNCRPASLPSVPGKITEKVALGAMEKHFGHNALTGHGQHSFTRANSCFTN